MTKQRNFLDNVFYSIKINDVIERSKCRATGKVRFTSARHASFFIRWSKWKHENWLKKPNRNKHRGHGKPTSRYVYFCEFCKGYHITKQHPYDYQLKKERYQKKYFDS